jgi:hypothetical protein
MVNGWLKSVILGQDGATATARTTKSAHFRHEICINQQTQRGPERSEVVLDQAILGLLINGRKPLPWGIKNKADLGHDSPVDGSPFAIVDAGQIDNGRWPGTNGCRH